VIDDQGNQLGIMSPQEAMRLAKERELDLVEVSPNARPPVCKIMDFGKFQYEQKKKNKEARIKQSIGTVKELKVRPKIDDHDFATRLKRARKFLQKGHKVKFTVRFRGRERAHPELAQNLLIDFFEELQDIAEVTSAPDWEGRQMTMLLSPTSAVLEDYRKELAERVEAKRVAKDTQLKAKQEARDQQKNDNEEEEND
jgi:translation initiation factor IF-3